MIKKLGQVKERVHPNTILQGVVEPMEATSLKAVRVIY